MARCSGKRSPDKIFTQRPTEGADPCWFGTVSADHLYKTCQMHRGGNNPRVHHRWTVKRRESCLHLPGGQELPWEHRKGSGIRCAMSCFLIKKMPMATLGVFCLHFCHICMFVPVCSQPLHLLMAVWVFLWLLFVSLQPFILFVVIYSHAEASHYSKWRKSQKSLRLKEMSKDYKKRPFFIPLQRDPLTIIPPATAVCPNTSICSGFVFAF